MLLVVNNYFKKLKFILFNELLQYYQINIIGSMANLIETILNELKNNDIQPLQNCNYNCNSENINMINNHEFNELNLVNRIINDMINEFDEIYSGMIFKYNNLICSYDKADWILKIDKVLMYITIYKYPNKFYSELEKFKGTRLDYYAIPSNLSLKKIISIVCSVLTNDYVNKTTDPIKKNCSLVICYRAQRIVIRIVNSISDAKGEYFNGLINKYFYQTNFELIIMEKFELFDYVNILYEL